MLDMLVNLYDLPEDAELCKDLSLNGIIIKRVLSPDKAQVLAFILENFSQGWTSESEAAFTNNPTSCFIAVKDKQIVGFACYDATARGFFGPTGVKETERGKRIGEALLKRTLGAMKEIGYGYAIIGWCDGARKFYEKTVGAVEIRETGKSVYNRLISQ